MISLSLIIMPTKPKGLLYLLIISATFWPSSFGVDAWFITKSANGIFIKLFFHISLIGLPQQSNSSLIDFGA